MVKSADAGGHDAAGQKLKYELSDARFKPIFYFLVGLIVLVAFSFGLMLLMFDSMEERAAAVDRPPSPLADPNALPPEPRLLSRPQDEYKAYLLEVEKSLQGYRWIDKEGGVVQIPIERAMELVAERLASAPDPAAPGSQAAGQ